ncbi:MAG TPA: protein kinase [Vicinamibacterales bacterium]
MKGDSALLALASSVADGEPVDWADAEARARDARERALIDRLRIIASIGEVHRSQDNDDPGDAAESRGRVVGHIVPGESRDRLEGTRWGHLVLQERVGAGVFGEVYRAFDESLRRDVALKLLKTGSRSADLLAAKILHEGRLLARIRHRNVVTVHGVDTHGDRVGLWMEFIRGCTLEQLLERQGPFGGREAVLIGQDLCRALAAVHGAGLVHRDVKAQNVIREEGGRVVLMDFGTGLLLDDETAVRTSPMAGTPLYLAPEVLGGRDASPQSDIYSLGVLLFHLVTGTYPYVASSLPELRAAQRRGDRKRLHDLRPDLAEGFVQVVERALETDPEQRYQSVGAMQRGLTYALGLESGMMTPVGRPQPLVGTASMEASMPAADGRRTTPFSARWQVWAPVAALAAALIAVSAWAINTLRTPAVQTPLNSMIVLPFAGLSTGDRDLSHGMELLIAERLAGLSNIRVLEYSAAMAERDRGEPVSEVLRRHGVDGAVQGSVTWSGGVARVSAEIVRAGMRTPVWQRQFERPVARAAELPRDVAREVVRALGIPVSPGDESRLAAADQTEPGVFEAYLRGRSAMWNPTADSIARAIEHFQTALQRDPNHAPSLAALSECYLLEGVTFRTRTLSEAALLARQAAERALAIDDTLAAAVETEAQLKFFVDWDAEGAERAFRRAIELSPNSSSARQAFAMFLVARNRLPDAMQQMQRAVSLDPASPQAQAALGMLWHYARQNDQAERIFREGLAADPNNALARFGLVRTLLAVGRAEEALQHMLELRQQARGQLSPAREAALGLAYAMLGRHEEARAVAERLAADDSADGGSVDAASIFAAIDLKDRALDILQSAVERRAPKCLFLRMDPRFDPLKHEPRFQSLVARVGFAS